MIGYDRFVQDVWYEPHKEFRPVRCAFCNGMLFRGVVEKVEIKCSRCGAIQVVQHNGNSCVQKRETPRHLPERSGYVPHRMVTDSAGRLVTIPRHPKRVVILNSSNVGLYLAAGGKPVGRVSSVLPADLEGELARIPEVGLPTNPDLKSIMALKPDLVIGMAFPVHQSLASVLERKGIPAILQTFDRYADILEALRFYGELNGSQNLAAEKIAAIEQHRLRLLTQIGGQPSPRVLIVWAIDGGVYAALSGSFIGDLVKRLGGVNLFDLLMPKTEKTAYAPLDIEVITEIQPDVILVIDHEFSEKANQGNQTWQHPTWRELNAVRQNRVYQLPYLLFAVNPGARIKKALSILAAFLYG